MDSVVGLTLSDLPGAAFMYSDVEKQSVLQLRRWLECRGMKRSGTKWAVSDSVSHGSCHGDLGRARVIHVVPVALFGLLGNCVYLSK